MRILQLLLVFSLLAAVFNSCTDDNRKSTSKILPESTFVFYFADSIVITEENKLIQSEPNQKKKMIDSLIHKYGINQSQLAATHRYYMEDLKRWHNFYLKVIERLEKLKAAENPPQKR